MIRKLSFSVRISLLTCDIQEKFLRWTSRVASYVTSIDQSTLLALYGYYKQATDGDNSTSKQPHPACTRKIFLSASYIFNIIAKPWWFMFEARKKWNSWNSLKGMNSSDAMTNYIQLSKEKLRQYY